MKNLRQSPPYHITICYYYEVSLSPLHQRHRDAPFLKHPPGREKRDSVPSMSQFSPRLTQQEFLFLLVPFPLKLLLQRFFTHSLYYSVLPILARWRDKRLAAQLFDAEILRSSSETVIVCDSL